MNETSREYGSSQKGRNLWIFGALGVAGALILVSLLQLEAYTVYFFTPDEAVAKAQSLTGRVIKVGGMVQDGSIKWDARNLRLEFVLGDLKGIEIRVVHQGTPPDLFKEGSGVVVEGRIDPAGTLSTSHTLMVKHSEEYKAPDATHSIDKELLERSIFKS